MAYSLNDVYRSLRTAMRFNGLTVGVGVGLLLLFAPQMLMSAQQIAQNAAAQGSGEPGPEAFSLWPYRMAGAALIALGLHLLFAAQERMVRASTMLAMLVCNGLIAVVLLIAFLQRELIDLSGSAQALFGAIFFICVVCAGFALRYLRADYNMT